MNNSETFIYNGNLYIIRKHNGENNDHFIIRCWYIIKMRELKPELSYNHIISLSLLYISKNKNKCEYDIELENSNNLNINLSILRK